MKLWKDFLEILKCKLGKSTINKWLYNVNIVNFDARNIYINITDPFQSEWVKEYLMPYAKQYLKDCNGKEIFLHIINSQTKSNKKPKEKLFTSDPLKLHCSLNRFKATGKNLIAINIIKKAIAEKQYNPIYIYTPPGYGKTHILMGIAKLTDPKNCIYVTGETFANHVVFAIKEDNLHIFRSTYRATNIVIIDNIQDLSNKLTTQEEFFHTFNMLYSENKQIVISGNVLPSDINNMEERIVSRLEWGIIVSISEPEDALEYILENWKIFYHLNVSKTLKEFILANIKERSMLTNLLDILLSRYQNNKIKLNEAKPIIDKFLSTYNLKETKVDQLLNHTAKILNTTKEQILGKSQNHDTSLSRQISMFILREKLKLTYAKIGTIFNRDHSTVMSSIKKINKQLLNNNKLNRQINKIIV